MDSRSRASALPRSRAPCRNKEHWRYNAGFKEGPRRGAGYQPGEANFAAIEAWNAASVYQRAIALMGRQIDGGE